MNTTDKIMALADEYMRRPLVDSRDGSTARNAMRAEIEALARDAERYRWIRDIATVSHPQVATPFGITYPTAWRFVTGGSDTDMNSAIEAAMQEKQS